MTDDPREAAAKIHVWRSPFGWWCAIDPNEVLATIEMPTVRRAWSRERVIEKWRRRLCRPTVSVEVVELGCSDD